MGRGKPEIPVEMGMQVCLPFSISLPVYVKEKNLICQVVGEGYGMLLDPFLIFQGRRIWDVPLTADKFI